MIKGILLAGALLVSANAYTGMSQWFNEEFKEYQGVIKEIDDSINYSVITSNIEIHNKNKVEIDIDYVIYEGGRGDKRVFHNCLPEIESDDSTGYMYLKYSEYFCDKRFTKDGYKDFVRWYMEQLSRPISNAYNGTFQKPVEERFQIK